jgi:hypothetical protein
VRRTASFPLLLLLAAAASPRSAAAAPPDPPDPPRRADPPIGVAIVAGVATALFPVALGAMYTASAGSDGQRNVGYVVGGAGLSLSPLAAHAVLGEWERAAAFGAVPVASEIAMCALVTAQPDAVFHGTVLSRTSFGILYSFDVFGAAAGIVDVMVAAERRSPDGKRSAWWPLPHVTLAPSVGRTHAGLVLGGTL